MTNEKISQLVTEKYQSKLKLLMNDVEKSTFSGAKWMRTHKLDTHFISKAVELGYIKPLPKIGKRIPYVAAYEPHEITLNMTIRLQEAIKEEIQRKRAKKKAKEERVEQEMDAVHGLPVKIHGLPVKKDAEILKNVREYGLVKSLADYTSEELVNELKARGFKGMLEKIEKYDF